MPDIALQAEPGFPPIPFDFFLAASTAVKATITAMDWDHFEGSVLLLPDPDSIQPTSIYVVCDDCRVYVDVGEFGQHVLLVPKDIFDLLEEGERIIVYVQRGWFSGSIRVRLVC
jgi:hypothetical protein